MVNLTPEHHKALDAIRLEKEKFETRKSELDARHERDVAAVKSSLVNAVKYAQEIGTPIRRIALDALNTKDTNTVYSMLLGYQPYVDQTVIEPEGIGEALTEPAVYSPEDNVYLVTDVDGDVYEFWGIDLGAAVIIERSDITGDALDSSIPAPAKVLAALKHHVPRADFSSLLDEEDGNE